MMSEAHAAFFAKYAPYAVQCGAMLGVSGNVILAQWAFESGYGTSHAALTKGNLAGINVPGGQGEDYATYATPSDFADAYADVLSNARYSQAWDLGDDAAGFVAGIKAGGYFTSDEAEYSRAVCQIAATNPAGLADT